MFDKLKAAGAIAGLMKNREAIQQAGERIKARLAELRIQGGSGGGAVRATVSGDLRVIDIHLDPPVLMALGSGDEKSKQMVQQLICEAVNNANDLAKAAAQREISREADALGLGGMAGELGGMLGQ